MHKPDLSDAREKLRRGRDHIADFEARIGAFLSTDFYRLRLEGDQQEGRMRILFNSLHQPDKRINAVIGDVVGNLRSALDYLVVALVAPLSGSADGLGFPFANDDKGFGVKVRSKTTLGLADAAIQDYFVQEVQAYNGGKGHALWVLNKLRNIDKHRLLVATASIAGVKASWVDLLGNTFTDCGFGILAGKDGTFIDAPLNGIKFTKQPKATFEIEFCEAPYVDGQPVSAFLDGVAGDVQRLLDEMEIRLN